MQGHLQKLMLKYVGVEKLMIAHLKTIVRTNLHYNFVKKLLIIASRHT